MEDEEMLDTTNETEKTDTQSAEENEDIELTDGTEHEETEDKTDEDVELKKEKTEESSNKSLADILAEKEEYQNEFNQRMQSRLARQADKIRRENDEKYGKLENLLSAGLGGKNLEENISLLEKMYDEQGIEYSKQFNNNKYSARDIEILANAEADSIIKAGYDEVVEETKRLVKIGYENMTDRDKVLFRKLDSAKKLMEDFKEARKMGLKDDLSGDVEFQKFVKDYGIESMSFSKKYELYSKIKNINDKTMQSDPGSLTNTRSKVEKEFFTSEEVDRLTEEQWNDPKILEKVERSMKHWD